MDKTILVERDFKDGGKLIQKLDKSEFKVHSALWFYNSEADVWRLLIATPLVDKRGPHEVYKKIKAVIDKMEQPFEISLQSISAISPTNQLIKILGVAIKTPPNAIGGIRFTRNSINNVFIEDAYIYRLQ
jgi:hypothetical protein